MVKNLNKEDLPDSIKNIDHLNIPKQNIVDLMYANLEDEAI